MMRSTQSGIRAERTTLAKPKPFPPPRDYSSLSMRDLLEAREAYQIYLSQLENVVATAIGRYRILKEDWNAEHASDVKPPDGYKRPSGPRTLGNSIVRPWSWPAVLVFVRQWATPEELKTQAVPKTLYLRDGRVVPTCVIQATPDETPAPPVPGPSQVSGLLGGGYACVRQHQGTQHVGTFGCLVYREGSYFALTNRHVAGRDNAAISAIVRGETHPVGVSANMGITRKVMSEVFPSWPGDKTYLTLDAGLVQVSNIEQWTSQAYGIGEIGPLFDATEQTISLDLVGLPVRAFGGTSGVIEGEIQALFFRYASLGGFDYTTDVLVGPRTGTDTDGLAPFTRPGDSGTVWFYDPPAPPPVNEDDKPEANLDPAWGERARRLRPLVMQWAGQRFVEPDGEQSAFALGAFLSTICSALDVEIVRDWSTGHDEYWGKLGHFAIGWKACDELDGKLKTLMIRNQIRIGFGDSVLKKGSKFTVDNSQFVPLADVPDYVWVHSSKRKQEPVQHFADVDIFDIDGNPSLLERCIANPQNMSASIWKQYFDGFANAGVGPDEGVLPLRVWQLWEAMRKYVRDRDLVHFVAAAGVLAHYIGDASQPMHASYLHHGRSPTLIRNGREYPVRHDSQEYEDFRETRESDIHGIFEETMIEIDTLAALDGINDILDQAAPVLPAIENGHSAAMATIRLMHAAQTRLPPTVVIDADDPALGPKGRAKQLWNVLPIRQATLLCLADSVRVLAHLWTTAWHAGDGDSIDPADLVQFSKGRLMNIYRDEDDFAPSLSLAEMVGSGNFEPA